MTANMFWGKLVRLGMVDPDIYAEQAARGSRNSEYKRLLDSRFAVPYSVRQVKNWFDKHYLEPSQENFLFTIHTLEVDRLIGEIELDGIAWSNRESFVGIGIGDPADWGKGFGTDAMRIVLRYAFTELNLRRVTLVTFEYNPRAIRSYKKAGFRYEGRVRQYLNREGRRWDLIYMGILSEEWKASGDGV